MKEYTLFRKCCGANPLCCPRRFSLLDASQWDQQSGSWRGWKRRERGWNLFFCFICFNCFICSSFMVQLDREMPICCYHCSVLIVWGEELNYCHLLVQFHCSIFCYWREENVYLWCFWCVLFCFDGKENACCWICSFFPLWFWVYFLKNSIECVFVFVWSILMIVNFFF